MAESTSGNGIGKSIAMALGSAVARRGGVLGVRQDKVTVDEMHEYVRNQD